MALLPQGEYVDDLAVLYRLDGILRAFSAPIRRMVTRAFLLVFSMRVDEEIKLILKNVELSPGDRSVLEENLGVIIRQDADGGEFEWIVRRRAELPCPAAELLFHDYAHELAESKSKKDVPYFDTSVFKKKVFSASSPYSSRSKTRSKGDSIKKDVGSKTEDVSVVDADDEKLLLRSAYEELQRGKASRSLMTRAQRIWHIYQKDYQKYPTLRVRLYEKYPFRNQIGGEYAVDMLSSCRDVLQKMTMQCEGEGEDTSIQKKLHCWRNAKLQCLEMDKSLLENGIKPPAISLFLKT